MKVHEACAFFPLLAGAEFDALKADIKANGQKQPILTLDGVLIDGRNRLRACKELGIEPRVEEISEKKAGDPFAFVMSLNFHRRHLAPHEKGIALKAYLQRKGWKKDVETRGGDRKSGSKNEARSLVTIKSAAKELGIATATAQDHLKAAETYEAAPAKVRAKIDAGELTTSQVAQAMPKVRAAIAELSDADKQNERKVAAIRERAQKDADEERTCLKWLDGIAIGADYYLATFKRRKWDKPTKDGIRAKLKRIAKAIREINRSIR